MVDKQGRSRWDGLVTSAGERVKPFVPPIVYDRASDVVFDKLRPNRYKNAVGGMWEEIGALQYRFMLDRGLEPHHTFLDVGCGTLRGGIHFVDYLGDGNYCGVDAEEWKIEKAKTKVLPEYGLVDANPDLRAFTDFGFHRFDQAFDYALAQSVFTHLPLNAIVRCLQNINTALRDDGKFYATFFETEDAFRAEPKSYPDGIATQLDADPYHYHFGTFEWVCEHIDGLSVEYIGDWDHPREQQMMVFTRADESSRA